MSGESARNLDSPDRRRWLALVSAVTAAVALRPGKAQATPSAAASLVERFLADEVARDTGLKLSLPERAENGNSVPLGVSVDSPMTDEDHVESILVVTERNPDPEVAVFHFSPASGQARVVTRMRLARTQRVLALARLSDGSILQTSKHVDVVVGGCGA